MRIPLYLNIPLLLLSLFFSFLQKVDLLYLFINLAVGFLFFYLIRILTQKGVGLGDAILSASIAIMLGIRYWMPAMATASLLALVYIFAIKLIKKKDIRHMRISFAPFISAGAVIFIMYGYFIN